MAVACRMVTPIARLDATSFVHRDLPQYTVDPPMDERGVITA